MAGDPPEDPESWPSPASEGAFDGADELAATLPSTKGLSKSARRMIFMAGRVGGGVALLAACISDKGVGLLEVSF